MIKEKGGKNNGRYQKSSTISQVIVILFVDCHYLGWKNRSRNYGNPLCYW